MYGVQYFTDLGLFVQTQEKSMDWRQAGLILGSPAWVVKSRRSTTPSVSVNIPLTFCLIHSNIKECYPESTMLSFDQVQTWLKVITGIIPLHFDMCVNTCLAYTGTFATLTECPFCGECQYQQHLDIDSRSPCHQFITIPIGPQLQALWWHPISVVKLQDCLWCTMVLLAQHNTDGSIQDYNDVCCGSEYLDLVKSRQICDNDMLLVLSMDGAQLYWNKESDT